jgi:hypothetical protein
LNCSHGSVGRTGIPGAIKLASSMRGTRHETDIPIT